MITLKNNVLTVLIDEMGAQIRSVKKNDIEYELIQKRINSLYFLIRCIICFFIWWLCDTY